MSANDKTGTALHPAGHAQAMTPAIFSEFLDRHGGDSANWPEESSGPAVATLAASPAARRMLADAQAVDATLSALAAPQPLDAALVGRIVSGLHGAKPHRERQLRLGFSRGLAMAGVWSLLLFAVLGIGLGLVVPHPVSGESSEAAPEVAVLVLGFDPGDLS